VVGVCLRAGPLRTWPTSGYVSEQARVYPRPAEVRSDGDTISTHTVVWTVGVTPPPLVRHLSLPDRRGRLAVDDHLQLRDGVWAAGDSAAARDPFSETDADYPPTAQHAQRQGVVMARNIAASLGCGRPRTYRHRDLGLVADLGPDFRRS
jgi:NADH:ubiquinone reductase (H+-translocating)